MRGIASSGGAVHRPGAAKNRREETGQHPVAGAMAGPVSSFSPVDTKAHHHIEMVRQQPLDHARGAGGIVGRVAVDQHVDIGVDVGEYARTTWPLPWRRSLRTCGPASRATATVRSDELLS
jgi:hypothetical protein